MTGDIVEINLLFLFFRVEGIDLDCFDVSVQRVFFVYERLVSQNGRVFIERLLQMSPRIVLWHSEVFQELGVVEALHYDEVLNGNRSPIDRQSRWKGADEDHSHEGHVGQELPELLHEEGKILAGVHFHRYLDRHVRE